MNGLSQLSAYRPVFFLQLFLAELIFSSGLKKKEYFWLRLSLTFVAGELFAFLLPISVTTSLNGSALFFLLFVANVFLMTFLYDENVMSIIFCACVAFTVQHIASELYELFYVFTGAQDSTTGIYGTQADDAALFNGNVFLVIMYLGIYVLTYYWLSCPQWFKYRAEYGKGLGFSSIIIIVLFTILVDIIFGAVAIWSKGMSRESLMLAHLWNLACCFLLLFLMFELLKRKANETELVVIKEIRSQEQKKYEQVKATREALNIRCHDLKHQIRLFGDGTLVNKRFVGELEKTIDDIDTLYTTGSSALDIILTEKDLLCRKAKIRFSAMVDGKCLGFLSDADIYSLFGNLLDNAIEASEKICEDERYITLTVKRRHSFVELKVTNIFSGELKKEGETIVTTKKNSDSHGYGLKSIDYVARRYDGTMNINAEGNIFCITLLFALPREDLTQIK